MTVTSPMVYCPAQRDYSQKWQFSVRGLMFITVVVAICAALAGVSPVLAVALLPLMVVGLIRTARAPKGSGLFVTFCESLVLAVLFIVVSAAALAVACVAGSLIVAGVAFRL